MDITVIKPMTMAELLPELGGGILTLEARKTLTTAKKQPRPKVAATRTSEKVLIPLTMAEMRADLQGLRVQSPKRYRGEMTASNKKKWNSSVKVDKKTINHTANGQMKHNSVRKVLNFQISKPRPPKMSMMPNSRATMMNSETPKFPKPELKAKKSLHIQAHTNANISGVYQIPETPIYKVPKSRMTIANKENITTNFNRQVTKQIAITPKPELSKLVVPRCIPDTPMSTASSCDDSFLQREKEIDVIENKNKVLTEEKALQRISEGSPLVSTPFKEYRNVTEFFNNSSAMENSNGCNDDTIMCFDTQPKHNENGKREESVIVSLCDMLNKATVSNTSKPTSELDELLEVEKQTKNNIKMIETAIKTLENIKQSDLKSLQYVKKLIQEKREKQTRNSESDNTVIETKDSSENTSINGTLVLKNPTPKSPTYKIPKKNTCLRKNVFHKSMPNVSNINTPQKDMGDKAFNMYMKMKDHMQFLRTPKVKQRTEVPDTPAITSQNLQKQLDKLYTQS